MEASAIILISKKSTGRKKLHKQNIWIIEGKVINLVREKNHESTEHQEER